MLIATFKKDGRDHLVLGLEEENIARLKDDRPIQKDLDLDGFPPFTVVILGPEDVVRFATTYGAKMKREGDPG